MPDIETGADTSVSTDAAPEWDGSFDTIDKQGWWNSVPEPARGHIAKWHTEGSEAKTHSQFLQSILDSDDVAKSAQEQIKAAQDELAGLKKSLGDSEAKIKAAEERAKHAEVRLSDTEADREFDRLEAKYPDIFKDIYVDEKTPGGLLDKGAYMRFTKLLHSGIPEDEAATMARALLPKAEPAPVVEERPKERDVKPPLGVNAATSGGNSPTATVTAREMNEDYDARAARMRREAGG